MSSTVDSVREGTADFLAMRECELSRFAQCFNNSNIYLSLARPNQNEAMEKNNTFAYVHDAQNIYNRFPYPVDNHSEHNGHG